MKTALSHRSRMASAVLALAVMAAAMASRTEAQSNLAPCPKDLTAYWNNCFGTYTDADENKYVGEWKNNKFNGQGTLTRANGDKYVGEWKDDKANGQGTYIWANEKKYVGEFKNNNFNGNGQEFAANGTLIREGYWIADDYFGPNSPADATESRIAMVKDGGTYAVPVTINGVLPLHFTVDSGAADVTIPADVALVLIRTGSLKDADFIGSEKYQLADGSVITSKTFNLRSLKVGDRTVTNVKGSVVDVNGSLLLGQSFLEKFKSWSMDNTKHELVLRTQTRKKIDTASQTVSGKSTVAALLPADIQIDNPVMTPAYGGGFRFNTRLNNTNQSITLQKATVRISMLDCPEDFGDNDENCIIIGQIGEPIIITIPAGQARDVSRTLSFDSAIPKGTVRWQITVTETGS